MCAERWGWWLLLRLASRAVRCVEVERAVLMLKSFAFSQCLWEVECTGYSVGLGLVMVCLKKKKMFKTWFVFACAVD
jgi:hypothetical protein